MVRNYGQEDNSCLLGSRYAYHGLQPPERDSGLCELLRQRVVPLAVSSQTWRAQPVVPLFFHCPRGLCR